MQTLVLVQVNETCLVLYRRHWTPVVQLVGKFVEFRQSEGHKNLIWSAMHTHIIYTNVCVVIADAFRKTFYGWWLKSWVVCVSYLTVIRWVELPWYISSNWRLHSFAHTWLSDVKPELSNFGLFYWCGLCTLVCASASLLLTRFPLYAMSS